MGLLCSLPTRTEIPMPNNYPTPAQMRAIVAARKLLELNGSKQTAAEIPFLADL